LWIAPPRESSKQQNVSFSNNNKLQQQLMAEVTVTSSNSQLATQSPVCVTGATGFVASHIIKQLLQKGYNVRGTVRSLKQKDKNQFLLDMEPKGLLELVEANLLEAHSFDNAVDGCEFVIHTASPYALDVKDPQKELVDPAVKGTLNVLESCQRSSTVKKVVLTSSVAAITDEPMKGHVYTEADWNRTSSLTRNPYYYSKVLAEEAAWNFVKQSGVRFKLVVINPFVVLGPELNSFSVNASNAIIQSLLSGKYPGIMKLCWGFVDVRDGTYFCFVCCLL